MLNDTYLTLTGNLTAAPKSGVSRSGAPWARIRLASTSRVFDRSDNQFRDGRTLFMDVVCWRRLAENVVSTLDRGDSVIVIGRVQQRSYDDQHGAKHVVTEVDAESIGPDLSRTPATLLRRVAVADRAAVDETADAAGEEPRADIEAPDPEPALA